MTTLTVCIPVYNGEGTIERAIRSVRAGEVDGGLEILVCDDGSIDDTWGVLKRLADELEAVRLLRHEQNRGRSATRNRLLESATGRFVTWLDADDEKYPGMLRAQLEHLQSVEHEHGVAALDGLLVYTNYHWHRVGWNTPKLMAPEPPDDAMRSLLDASFGGYLWLTMGLGSTYGTAGPFDVDLPRLQDLAFFIRFAELGGRFERVADSRPLCVYHKDDGGRDACAVWRAWNRIWRTYRHHYTSFGMRNARRWRRHHYRVSRRFARANGNAKLFWWILALEAWFVVRGRFRRLVFDA